MKKLPLTAVVLTRNEAFTIERCLRSVNFASEILVFDDNSSDDTVKLAEENGAYVVKRSVSGDFAAQRNTALSQAKYDWVLFVDADEEVTRELAQSIEQALNQKDHADAFSIKRRDFYSNHELKYGEVRKVRRHGLVRLMKKNSGIWHHSVHEEFRLMPGHRSALLAGFLNHYPHASLSQFLSSINHYSTIRARDLLKQHHKTGVWEIAAYPFGKFLYTYIWLGGFRDGAAGFTYSFLMSFHSFLVRAKLYQYTYLDSRTHTS